MKNKTVTTRIISLMLALITAVSVLSAAAVPASAASTINTESLIKSIAKDAFSKVTAKICGGNIGTQILGDTCVTLFNSYIGGDSSSDAEVLNAVSEISNKMDQYHDEEINLLNDLSEKIEEMHDDINTQPFRADYDHMRVDAKRELSALAWLDSQEDSGEIVGKTAEDFPIIDKTAHDNYHMVLTDAAIDESKVSDDLLQMYQDITGNSTQLKNQNPYMLLIDADARVCNASDFSYDQDVLTAPSITSSRDTIDCIQADVMVHYTAYINYIKVKFLNEVYEHPENAKTMYDYYFVSHGDQLAVVPELYREMKEIQASFDEADAYFNSLQKAHITYIYHDVKKDTYSERTAYYNSPAIAWAAATCTGRENYSDVTVTLDSDWKGGSTGSRLNLPQQCEWKEIGRTGDVIPNVTYALQTDNIAFYSPALTTDSRSMPVYYSDHSNVSNITLDINGYTMDTGFSGLNWLNKTAMQTNNNTKGHVNIIDSLGTGTLNDHAVSEYKTWFNIIYFRSFIVNDSTMTWTS